MIMIPIFIPQPKIGTYVKPFEECSETKARREAVLKVLRNGDKFTLSEIALQTQLNVRIVQGILTALKKNGKVISSYIQNEKVWRINNE